MNLIEKLRGTRTERQADLDLKRLSKIKAARKNGTLSTTDQARWDRATQLQGGLRRRRFIAAALGIPTSVYLAVGTYQWQQERQVDEKLQELREKETRLEPILATFENGFKDFHQRIVGLMAIAGTSPQDRTIISRPFDIFDLNKPNQDRNFYTWHRKFLEKTRSLQVNDVKISDVNYFFYDFGGNLGDYAASFSAITRTTKLSPRYQPTNMIDNILAAHEMLHAWQDAEERKTNPAARSTYYNLDVKGRQKAVSNYEAEAFAEEIYLADLLTSGQLRQDSLKGMVDPQKYARLLNGRNDQFRVVKDLTESAFRFFGSGSTISNLDPRFTGLVVQLYREQGFLVFDRTPSGFVLRP